MKKILLTCFAISFLSPAKAQYAMDFNMSDCNDSMHHLFADYLDNEEVVIIEYFMVCTSCIEVGQKITPMFNQLSIDYPGMVHFFAFNFNDDFACSVATGFVTDNGINAIPFDSGAAQIDYYGGFGMPSVAIVGGSQHEVIYFSKTLAGSNDTAAMDNAIRDFFTTLGNENEKLELQCSIYPNPSTNMFNIELNAFSKSNCNIKLIDITGRIAKQISNSQVEPGINKFQVDVSELINGIYFVSIELNGKISRYKINIKH